MHHPNVFFSNWTEVLYEQLKKDLFTSENAFAKRMIVVPSEAMKSWLMLRMADDPAIGIAAGIEIAYLEQIINRLSNMVQPVLGQASFLNNLQLALLLEKEIRGTIANATFLSDKQKELWQPLFHYLKVNVSTQNLSVRTSRRLTALCEKLSSLFYNYGIYGSQLTTDWEASKESLGWQQELWRKIFLNNFSYSSKHLGQQQEIILQRNDVQVHIFALSFIPRIYHAFLDRMSACIPIHYYMLSPCHLFWSDICSDKESRYLQSYWQKKGVSEKQQADLAEYLRDRNPLLANFGRLGREMAVQLEETNAITNELYVYPEQAHSQYAYQDVLVGDGLLSMPSSEFTLLNAIQTDMVCLRNPEVTEKVRLRTDDRTVQVHSAPTMMREIEVLYDLLANLIRKHSNEEFPIQPGNIIVMAPNIADYVPYIHAIFGSKESRLQTQIMDLSMLSQSRNVQDFMHLLALPFGRWDALNLLNLFDSPSLQKRHQLNLEDIRQIKEWVKIGGVRWGSDSTHRNEVLLRNHCRAGMMEDANHGTWENALESLLNGIALYSQEDSLELEGALPLAFVDITKSALLGKWAFLLRALKADLKCLTDGTLMALGGWSRYLQCLYESYFESNDDNAVQELLKQVSAFKEAETKVGTYEYPFTAIRCHLLSAFTKHKERYFETYLHAVRFCSMFPMRAIPADVVVMIGMQEGAFPRQETAFSLDLINKCGQADYCPSQTDYDRFLFLEAVLSARRYFIMTYQGQSVSDGKEQPPSLLTAELLDYLNKAFTLDGSLPSEKCVYKHPLIPFHHSYFEKNSAFKSFSKVRFSAAKAFYNKDKDKQQNFISEFPFQDRSTDPEGPLSIRVSVKQLDQMAKNPLKPYFNQKLGIYLDDPKKRHIQNDEDFLLPALDHYILKRESLKKPVDNVLQLAERSGKIPFGPFKETSKKRIINEISDLLSQFELLEIRPNEIFHVTLCEHCQSPICNELGQWKVPALQLSVCGKIVKITGELPEICSKGLIAHVKDDRSDILKAWPQFLILSAAIYLYQLPIEMALLPIKGQKVKVKKAFFENPMPYLISYLEYYFRALETASPLIPEWVPAIISQGPEEFHDHMHKSLTNPFQPLRNDYLLWAIKKSSLPNSNALLTNWKPQARSLFLELYEVWF